MTVKNPLPFAAALWARLAETSVTNVFVTMTFVAILLFSELNNIAEVMSLDNSALVQSCEDTKTNLENWRFDYELVCRFVEMVCSFFGPILLIKTALGFAIPIFEFNKILFTNGQEAKFYFDFGHTIIQFLLTFLIPSYAVTNQVRTNFLQCQKVKIQILKSFFFFN